MFITLGAWKTFYETTMMTIIWYAKKSKGKPKYVSWVTNINGMERERVRKASSKYRHPEIVPKAAIYYNKYKGGIDASDHLVRNVDNLHKHMHAFRAKGTMFLHNLMVNSYIYYKRINNLHKRFTSKDYLLKVLEEQYNQLVVHESTISLISLNTPTCLSFLTPTPTPTKLSKSCTICKKKTKRTYVKESCIVYLCNSHACIVQYYLIKQN
jgi:hypothetical protein